MPLHQLARWLERMNEPPVVRWLVLAGVAIPLILSVVVSAQYFALTSRVDKGQKDRDQFVACIASWADQYTARAERVTDISSDKTNAQDVYITALSRVLDDAIRKDPAAVARDLPEYQQAARSYQAASAELRQALARNPIPSAPQFTCH